MNGTNGKKSRQRKKVIIEIKVEEKDTIGKLNVSKQKTPNFRDCEF